MISDRNLASEVSAVMLEYGARLNGLVAQALTTCPDPEFQKFRRAVGVVMGDMLLEIMNPLYARHPDIKPEQLK